MALRSQYRRHLCELALRDLARRTSAGPLATRPTAAELLQLLAALAPDAS